MNSHKEGIPPLSCYNGEAINRRNTTGLRPQVLNKNSLYNFDLHFEDLESAKKLDKLKPRK